MKKLIAPAVVILMAVTSAFSTGDSSNKKLAVVPGFIKQNVAGTNCEQKDDCSNIDTGTLCRVGQSPMGAQLWIYDENGECLDTGFKPTP
jgi:hypothetical protein